MTNGDMGGDPTDIWWAPPEPAPKRRSRRRVVLAVGAVVALAALCAGVLIAVRPGDEDSSAGGQTGTSATPDEAPPYAAVEAILTRRSSAVQHDDRSAFLADLDSRSTVFVGRQKRLFRNLERLPLGDPTWRKVSTVEESRPDLVAEHGGPVYVAWVEFDYRLKGFDTDAVAVPMAFTFVQRDGRWLLADDDDIADLPTRHGPEIWERAAIAVARGKQCLVIGTRRDASQLRRIASQTDQAVRQTHRLWSDLPTPRVVVYVPRDPASRADYFAAGKEQSEGVEFSVLDHVPQWTDRAWPISRVGTRVVLNTATLDELARHSRPDLVERLIAHEVTHVATSPWTGDAAPTWVVEGSAEYTAFRDDVYGRQFPDAVFRAAASGHLLTSLVTGRTFYRSPVNYDKVYLLYAYIRMTYGEADIVKLYRLAGKVDNPKRTKARSAAAVRTVFGFGQDELLRRFNAWAQQRVRPAGTG